MTVLDRKLRRDLYAYRWLLATVISIITIGIAGFVANLSFYFNMELSRRSFYAQSRMADFWVDIQRFPRSELRHLDDIEGIAELYARISHPVTVDLDSVERPMTGQILSLPTKPTPVINNIVIKSGGYFTDLRREEVIVNDAFARARNLRPGDTLHVFLNGKRQSLLLVGTAVSAEFVQNIPPGGFMPTNEYHGILYVKDSFAEEALNYTGAANQIVGLLTSQARGQADRVLADLRQRLEEYGEPTVTPLKDQSSHFALSAQIEQQRTIALIMPSVFLLVAAGILNLLMMRVAEQQRTVVGTLKALGHGRGTLLIHYLTFGVVIGLIGGVAGSMFGFYLAGLITDLNRPYFEFPRFVNQPYPFVFLPCILISVVLAGGGTLHGITAVWRLTPAEAMRPKPPPVARRTLLERWTWLWSRVGFRWQMVFRNIVRQRLRTITTVGAAAMGTMLILASLQLVDGVLELLSFTYDKMLVSDYDLTLDGEYDYGAFLELKRFSGVDYAEPRLVVGCTFYHQHVSRKGAVTGILPRARLTIPRDAEGRPVTLPATGLLVTRELARLLDLQVGDHVRMVPLKGDQTPRVVQVSRIAESYVGSAAYANLHFLNRLMGEEDAINSVQLKMRTSGRGLGAFYQQIKQTPGLRAANSIRDEKENLESLLTPFYVMVVILILFAGFICAGSMLNAAFISISERRQEIATLRVLGYTARDVSGIFWRQSLTLNAWGILFGLPLGYLFSIALCRATATEMLRFPFVIRLSTWLITVTLGFAFAWISHLPVHRAIQSMNWLEALNVKE